MEDVKLDPDLDGVANALKKGYAERRTEQQGRKYRPADRFLNMHIWYGAARKCAELAADPDDFLDAAFNYCSIPGGPFPQNLATRAMDRWYREHAQLVSQTGTEPLPKGETVYSLSVKHRIKGTLMTGIQLSKRLNLSLSRVLQDDIRMSLDLYPAFTRVLLLPGDKMIQAKWGAKARAEIMSNPRLLKMLMSSTFDLSWL